MKTYFAKYFQVAGSIEDDDFFLTPDGRISQCKQVLESLPATIMNYSVETWKENELKKVKLFLCSRDIQVGDKVYHDYMKHILGGKSEVVDDEDLEFLKTHDAHKVIGPISPQAVWVKEGDEFDEEDWDDSEDLLGNSMIHIKCPTCKTFH